MPRWFIVTLTWTLFAAVMLAIGWALKQVVPTILARVASHTGWGALVAVLLLIGVVSLGYGLWPRDAAGRMRRLSARR